MANQTWWEKIETKGGEALDQLKRIINEGNIRRVRVRQKDRVIAEFPLTVGVVGAVLAPVLAAIGAVTALITECTIEVEREAPVEESTTAAPPPTTDDTVGTADF
jgi:hypothetical protein